MSYETRLRKLEQRSTEVVCVIAKHECADDGTLTAYGGRNGKRFERRHDESVERFQARYQEYRGSHVIVLSETDAAL